MHKQCTYVAILYLYVCIIGIPAAENLIAVDSCTSVTVSWNITDEISCEDLSYNVSLISRGDGIILQSIRCY